MRIISLLFVSLAVLCGVSCATSGTLMPAEQQTKVVRNLQGDDRYLKLSFYALPFFGDKTKRLLSPVAPDEVRLLEDASGENINPGNAERIFKAGTRARILKVEFPGPLTNMERVLYTPRSQPWVFVDLEGTEKGSPPYILVLRPNLRSEADFEKELDLYLAKEDVRPAIQLLSPEIQEAIGHKRAVTGMPAQALEMAWGYPERIVVTFEGETRKETWIWPSKHRQVVVADNAVRDVFDNAAVDQTKTEH